jgi:hypothetical protein
MLALKLSSVALGLSNLTGVRYTYPALSKLAFQKNTVDTGILLKKVKTWFTILKE